MARPQQLLLLALAATDYASALTCDSPELAGVDYCNSSLPIAARVEALVGQLTMEEKTAKVLESGGSVPRLGIPELASTECLRGYLSMFPQALTMSQVCAQSCTHNVPLTYTRLSTLIYPKLSSYFPNLPRIDP